jgi:hypothetical protein
VLLIRVVIAVAVGFPLLLSGLSPPQGNRRQTHDHPAVVNRVSVARSIYGLVTVLAVLQVMEEHPPTAWEGAATLFGTTLAVALLEAYCNAIAQMLSERRSLARHELRAIWRDVAPVLIGAQGQTLLLVASVFGLLDVEDAIWLAQAVALLFLFAYGWRLGRALHETLLRQILSGLMLVAIGAFVVGIKVAFH